MQKLKDDIISDAVDEEVDEPQCFILQRCTTSTCSAVADKCALKKETLIVVIAPCREYITP